MTPNEKAKAWLLSHGYSQWADDTWQAGGYEADPAEALAEYIEEQEKPS